MPRKTRRKFEEGTIRKAYFYYWKLQNDPDYVEFYRKNFIPQRLSGERYSTWASRSGYKQKMELTIGPQLLEKFKLSHRFPVDPFKKVDWSNFEKAMSEPDQEILKTFAHFRRNGGGPVIVFCPQAFGYAPSAVFEITRRLSGPKYPFCFIPDVVDGTKEEILETISQKIDGWRRLEMVRRLLRRAPVNKFHLYAQVWDFRRPPNSLSFPQIARKTKTGIATVKTRFYRAFELIYNQPFNRDLFKEIKIEKQSLTKVCDNCSDRKLCRAKRVEDLCPDVISYVMQDQTRRREKQFFDFDALSDHSQYRKWSKSRSMDN